MEPAWLAEIEPATSPPFVRMGTRALGGGPWLLGGEDVPAQLAEKRRILAAHHDEVVATLPAADAAAGELLATLVAALRTPDPPADPPDPADPPARANLTDLANPPAPADLTDLANPPAPADLGDLANLPAPADLGDLADLAGGGTGLHPIDAAARLVAEDLCLLVPGGGGWVLAAGSVCFPSHWRLTEKLGLPLAAVHDPVPDYADELAGRVDRFLDKLRAGRGVVRRNWIVHTSPDLFAPDAPPPPDPPVAPAEAGERLWFRSERQTLVRLPRTGAIVFTIRTQQVPLAAVATHPELRARLARAITAWPPHQVAYRGGEPVRRPLLAWLRSGPPTARIRV